MKLDLRRIEQSMRDSEAARAMIAFCSYSSKSRSVEVTPEALANYVDRERRAAYERGFNDGHLLGVMETHEKKEGEKNV